MPFDIGIGLIVGVLLYGLSNWNYALCLSLGVLCSLLPDIDYIYVLARKRRLPHSEHRDGLHYPLLFIPFFGLAGTLLSPYLGLCFVIGSFIHFLHDSIGVGWGVKWFFPFGHKSYMFLYKARFPTSKTRPTKLVYSWTDVQRTEEIKLYADPEWIRHMYLAVHPFGLLEYSVFAIGILTAILYR